MISIRQRDKKWRIQIRDEEWEFPDRKNMEKMLKEILDTKEKFGKISQE